MEYALEKITTAQACDALLAGAKKKKLHLERRVRNLGESLVTFHKRLDQVYAESAEVQSSLETFADAYASLSESKDKANMKIRIKRLELQQAMLERKAATYNVGALLVKELQYNTLHRQVGTLKGYIAELEQRIMELQTPTLHIVQPAALMRRPAANPVFIPPVLRLPEVRIGQGEYLGLSYRNNVA